MNDSMDLLRLLPNRSNIRDWRPWYIALTAPVIGYLAARGIIRLAGAARYTGASRRHKIYRAPIQDDLTAQEIKSIAYAPNTLPGGRDVETIYGSTRVYEFGPETGRKTLFVHGVSTPSIVFSRLARLLAENGCRVMLFDLYGRGYSDCPDPDHHPQDMALFNLQIFAVLSSSKLNWLDGFTMVGYSMGGGISVEFCSYFPNLVESLVLIAPGGILRPFKNSVTTKLMYSDCLPDAMVNWQIGRTLQAASDRPKPDSSKGKLDITNAATEEVPDDHRAHAEYSSSSLSDDRPDVSAASAVAWQVSAHEGFVPSFVSSVKYAPIHNGHDRWRVVGQQCDKERNNPSSSSRKGLQEGKVLIILGWQDAVVPYNDLSEDATSVLGTENVLIVPLNGGHDLPITNSEGCANTMMDFWANSR